MLDKTKQQPPMIGQGTRSDTSELSPLGNFIERMMGAHMYRADMAALLGVTDKYLIKVFAGTVRPSQPWLIDKGWEKILSETAGWKANPAAAKEEFDKLYDAAPKQASHEQKPPIEGTMGLLFDVVFPNMKRAEQANALGIQIARAPMTGFANSNTINQEQMALWNIRLKLQAACIGREHLWDNVAEKFDAIANAKITKRIASTNTATIKAWRAAVGEVFQRIRAHAAPMDKADVFLETFDNADTPIFANGHYDMSGGYYKAMEQGRGFDEKGYLTPNGIFTSRDYQKTRMLYLRVATQMAMRYLGDEQDAEQAKLRGELDNVFPEMPIARRKASLQKAVQYG